MKSTTFSLVLLAFVSLASCQYGYNPTVQKTQTTYTNNGYGGIGQQQTTYTATQTQPAFGQTVQKTTTNTQQISPYGQKTYQQQQTVTGFPPTYGK
jgi:hypothetical protein